MTVGLCSIVRLPALSFDYVGIWSQVIASPMSCIWARMGKSFIFVSPIGTKNRVLMSFSSTRYRSLGSFHALPERPWRLFLREFPWATSG